MKNTTNHNTNNHNSKKIYYLEENGKVFYKGIPEQEPHRNYLCPEYDRCLDTAAKKNQAMYCASCPNRKAKRAEFLLTMPEIYGCVALVHAIFFFPSPAYPVPMEKLIGFVTKKHRAAS